MADIISLDNRLQSLKKQKDHHNRKKKLLVVRKVFQCTHCNFKCEKCGTQINTEQGDGEKSLTGIRIPYRFCESCSEEYRDYINQLKGGGDPDYYWHNAEWLDVWQKWIEYQATLDRYLKSKGFVRLLHELRQADPVE